MIPAWKLVLDETAFQFALSCSAPHRRALFAAFEKLRQNPRRQSDYSVADSTGRSLSVLACKPFLITYWLDALVTEIRIVDIQRIRF